MKKLFKRVRSGNLLKILLTATAVMALVIVLPRLVMAAPAQTPPPTPSIDAMYQEIQNFLGLVLEVLSRIIWPVLLMIGGLLKNDILFGAGMEERMLLIWVQIRNLVNILFVVILLGIALYNVVGGPKQEFQLKQILPKFVIALIAVNFSFIAIKVVLDTVNVMTTAIFALPLSIDAEALGKTKVNGADFQQKICEGFYGTDDYVKRQEVAEKSKSALCDGKKKLKAENVALFEYFNSSNAAAIMALELQNISQIEKVADLSVPSLKELLSNTMFSVVMFIIYGTAFVALFVILLVRMVVLWVALVLSPVMMISYALPPAIMGAVGGLDNYKKKIIATAIAPIPIALVLTIGYIMAMGLKTAKFSGATTGLLNTNMISMGLATSGISTFQELIAAIGTAAVVWMGVFAAADGTFADSAVKQIKSTVEGVGKFAMGAIQYAPVFPVSTGGKSQNVSLAAMQALPDKMEGNRRTKASEQADFLMPKSGDYVRSGQKIRNATTKEDIQQGLLLGGTAMVNKEGKGDDNVRALGAKLSEKPELQRGLDFTTVRVKGKLHGKGEMKELSQQDLVEAMKSNDSVLDQESFERWRQHNTRGVTAPPPDTDKKQGEAAAQPPIDASRANDLAADASRYGSADDQKKIAAYKKVADSKAKDDVKEKALQDKELQAALGRVEAAKAGEANLKSTVDRGSGLPTTLNAIAARRKQLNDSGVTEKTQQDNIIKQELTEDESVRTKVEAQTKGSATPGKVDGIDVSAPAPVTTPAPDKKAPPQGGPAPTDPNRHPRYGSRDAGKVVALEAEFALLGGNGKLSNPAGVDPKIIQRLRELNAQLDWHRDNRK